MKQNKIIIIAAMILSAALLTGCNLDEKVYSTTSPDTFFTSENNVYAVLARPFAHWYYYVSPGRESYRPLELSADEICCPKRGSDFYNGGKEQQLWYHTWTPDHSYINTLYDLTLQGVAYALSAYDDLSALDYTSFGLSDKLKEQHLGQLEGIIGFYYLCGLDAFGGMPIYDSSSDGVKPRSTEKETFDHIESLLTDAIAKLPAKASLHEKQDGYLRKGSAALLLARLYFNAEKYLVDRNSPEEVADLGGVDYFAKAAAICQDLIDGKYGPYEIEDDWTSVRGFDNDISAEAMWNTPCKTNYLDNEMWYRYVMPYNANKYFNIETYKQYNGYMLTPSLNPKGQLYNYKLGNTFSHYNDQDIRKQPYRYLGNKKYQGFFLMGELVNEETGESCLGNREYAGKTITLVDQVARFSELGKKYATVDDLTSTMNDGEESSGIREVMWPVPDQADVDIRWDPDFSYLRYTEVYYTLAECKMREGDKAGAAKLINTVRKRYFANGVDPDPVTADNLDMYRMLDEWQIEFLGEGRRRTDLIRWDQFTEGEWWDHKPTTKKYLNRFPIPTAAIVAAEGKIEQNPGYSSAVTE